MSKRSCESAKMDAAIGHGMRAVLISLALLFSGCGGGGGDSAPTAIDTANSGPVPRVADSFAITGDNYGIEGATYLAATKSASGITLRAAVASSMTDQNFQTVTRIDIADPGSVRAGVVYSLGGGSLPFPGTVYFFNGHPSSLLQTTGGTITFTSYGNNPGDIITGTFSAVVLDGNDSATPKASYSIAADFSFTAGSYGPILPAPTPVPLEAPGIYGANCASCHRLGSLDSAGSGPELSLKGGRLSADAMFSAGMAGHQGITLAASELSALKILLNVN